MPYPSARASRNKQVFRDCAYRFEVRSPKEEKRNMSFAETEDVRCW